MFGKNSARINITVRNTIQRLEPITLNSQSCSQTQKQSDTVHSEEHNSPRGTKSLHNIRSCRSIMRQIQNTEVPHSLIQNLSQVQQWKKKNPVSHSCYQLHPNIALDGQVKKKKKGIQPVENKDWNSITNGSPSRARCTENTNTIESSSGGFHQIIVCSELTGPRASDNSTSQGFREWVQQELYPWLLCQFSAHRDWDWRKEFSNGNQILVRDSKECQQ